MRLPRLEPDDHLRAVERWLERVRDDGVPRARRWLANHVLYPLYERTLPPSRRLNYHDWQNALRESYYRNLNLIHQRIHDDRQTAWREAVRSTIICYGECPVAPQATEVRGDHGRP